MTRAPELYPRARSQPSMTPVNAAATVSSGTPSPIGSARKDSSSSASASFSGRPRERR